MTETNTSLHCWLREQVSAVLERKTTPPPFLLWCDSDREWLEMLRVLAAEDGFELWADPEEHELAIKDRFYSSERSSRVVWLPTRRQDISWFKVYELQAECVWEKSLLQGLREYGVNIPRDTEADLLPLLPAHTKEWFDNPKETWKELTPGSAKGTLIDDYRMLQVIAGEPGEFNLLRQENRFDIFARRAKEDFGLPDPASLTEEEWRVAATARLLVTEAAGAVPSNPPSEQDKIIQDGLPRDRALKLLRSWQENIHFISSFEHLSQKADDTISLANWARNLPNAPKSKSSRAVEESLFKGFAERLERITDVNLLNQELDKHHQQFLERQSGFWSQQAQASIGWRYLVMMAQAASLLVETSSVECEWKAAKEAIDWYVTCGWQLDFAGEMLFQEEGDLPQELHRIRTRVRRAYLRSTDRIGCVFSELLSNDSEYLSSMPTSGEVSLHFLEEATVPTAIVFIDALRFDLGKRLAEMLNVGEPVQRATISAAVAPLPSITALGMAYALPITRGQFSVTMGDGAEGFRIFAAGSSVSLAVAATRREWLSKTFRVKDFFNINEVLDGQARPAGKPKPLIVVECQELDKAGHPGELQITGASDLLDRYARAIRRLREHGYSRVAVVTDHGFFHWQPEDDEIEETKPTGGILWTSRRAIVGRGLSHPSALHMQVPNSDLEAVVPRSTNAFKTYGGLGFFHGGATLQELIIPVVTAVWPTKAFKIGVVLKPVEKIASETPRVQVQCCASEQQSLFGSDENILARQVIVKVLQRETGKLVFISETPATVKPDDKLVIVQLALSKPVSVLKFGEPLSVIVIDADDEEILAREEVELKVDIDEW